MDFSSLSEAQQQQLQQLHQQFQQHQQEQQKQQELASQTYDHSQAYNQSTQAYDQSTQAYDQPTQAYEHSTQVYDQSTQAYDQSSQAYDQSSQAYYPYHQYPQHHQQHYPYYQPDYANAYQPQSQPSQSDVQPPGISVQQEASSQALPATPGQGHGQYHQQQHNAYYPQGVAEHQQNSSSSYPVPSGLNPAAAAAVAALSQLTQFAGNMDAAERAMAGLQERQWQAKSGGYRPVPPHMCPRGGFHHEQYPVRGAGRGGGQYRGGGRRSGGQFRGGRGNFGNRQCRADGSTPRFRGKGRGRGRGRRFPPHEGSSSPFPETAPMDELDSAIALEEGEQLAVEQGEALQTAPVPTSGTTAGQAPQSTQAPGRTASSKRPQIAWCELCRVDCTSLDILEQHKSGKRHKKNLQRFEELQQARNPMLVVAHTPIPIPASVPVTSNEPIAASVPVTSNEPIAPSVPESVPSSVLESVPSPMPSTALLVDGENEQTVMPECELDVPKQPKNDQDGEIIKELVPANPANMTTEVATDEHKMETEQQKDVVEQPDMAEAEPTEGQPRKRRMDRFEARRRGVNKMTMRGGRVNKRMKMTDRPSRSVEPPREVVPIICDLCNVKCDTQAVFDCHLSGKKHISKLKRFQGHQAIYGPVGLQALYPPNPNTQPIFIPQMHHPQPKYVPQTPLYPNSTRAYVPAQGHHVAAGSETQERFNSVAHAPEINAGGNQVTVSMGPVEPQQTASLNLEYQPEQPVGIKSDNGITVSGGSEHVVQSHTSKDAV